MEHLSREAEDVLDTYRGAREPGEGDEARAWQRLSRSMREEEAAELERVARRRGRRRRRRLLWRAMRPAVLATTVVGIVYLTARSVYQMDEAALMNDVEALMGEGEHELAYAKLVEHSRRLNTRPAAERRMGLVVDCLCALNRPLRAREQLERYVEINPESMHADRIDDVCPGMEVPERPDPTEEFPTQRLQDKSLTVIVPPSTEAEIQGETGGEPDAATTEVRTVEGDEVVKPGKFRPWWVEDEKDMEPDNLRRRFHWSSVDPNAEHPRLTRPEADATSAGEGEPQGDDTP